MSSMVVGGAERGRLMGMFYRCGVRFLVLFSSFFEDRGLPGPSPILRRFFRCARLESTCFCEYGLVRRAIRFCFFGRGNVALLELSIFSSEADRYLSRRVGVCRRYRRGFIGFLGTGFGRRVCPRLCAPRVFCRTYEGLRSFCSRRRASRGTGCDTVSGGGDRLGRRVGGLVGGGVFPRLCGRRYGGVPSSSVSSGRKVV